MKSLNYAIIIISGFIAGSNVYAGGIWNEYLSAQHINDIVVEKKMSGALRKVVLQWNKSKNTHEIIYYG